MLFLIVSSALQMYQFAVYGVSQSAKYCVYITGLVHQLKVDAVVLQVVDKLVAKPYPKGARVHLYG